MYIQSKISDPDQIGAALVAARAQDPAVPWKVLMGRYGKGRTWLYQLWQAALADPSAGGKDVH